MWTSKRKRRQENSKKWMLPVLFLLVGTLGLFTYFLFSFLQKPLLVSPLPLENKKEDKIQELKQILSDQKISFSDVTIASDSSYVVRFLDGGEVLFSSKKNIASQVASLQLVRNRLTIEGTKFRRLDFRFENPIIEFNEKQ